MRSRGPLRSVTALCLLALLGALATGLPSHHHDGGGRSHGVETRLVSADHHAHGTRLVEQDERSPSGGLQIALIARVRVDVAATVAAPAELPGPEPLRPMERAPPPGAPRAPPPSS